MRRILLCCLVGAWLLASCQPPATTPPPPTSTPDPCAPENIVAAAGQVHRLMRQFDDTSFIAQQTPQAQLAGLIMSLQQTRRSAEDLAVPACLVTLKQSQLDFMNAVIITLTNFMGGASPEQVNAQIVASRQLRSIYDAELARLIGATLAPSPTPRPTWTPAPATPTSAPTSTAVIPVTGETPSGSPALASVTVAERVNMRAGPGTDYAVVGALEPGDTVAAVAKSEDGGWILIQHIRAPSGSAWVLAELVSLSVSIEQLPTATP